MFFCNVSWPEALDTLGNGINATAWDDNKKYIENVTTNSGFKDSETLDQIHLENGDCRPETVFWRLKKTHDFLSKLEVQANLTSTGLLLLHSQTSTGDIPSFHMSMSVFTNTNVGNKQWYKPIPSHVPLPLYHVSFNLLGLSFICAKVLHPGILNVQKDCLSCWLY